MTQQICWFVFFSLSVQDSLRLLGLAVVGDLPFIQPTLVESELVQPDLALIFQGSREDSLVHSVKISVYVTTKLDADARL